MQQRELTNLEIKEDGGSDRFRRDLRVRRAAAIFCCKERFYDALGSGLSFPNLYSVCLRDREESELSKQVYRNRVFSLEEEIYNLHRGSTEIGAGMMSYSGSSAWASRSVGPI